MLREKLAHKPEDNIGLSQTTLSIVIIISHVGGSTFHMSTFAQD